MNHDQQSLTAGGFNNMTLLGITRDDYQKISGDKLTGQNGNGNTNMLYWAKRWLGSNVVFVIQRLMNRNVLAYRTTGDVSNPVEATWLMIPDELNWEDDADSDSDDEDTMLPLPRGITTEELTRMESTMAYGIESMGINLFGIRALGGEPIRIDDDQAKIQWQNTWCTLTEIVVHTEPRFMGLWPRVTQLDICAEDEEGEGDFILHFQQS